MESTAKKRRGCWEHWEKEADARHVAEPIFSVSAPIRVRGRGDEMEEKAQLARESKKEKAGFEKARARVKCRHGVLDGLETRGKVKE